MLTTEPSQSQESKPRLKFSLRYVSILLVCALAALIHAPSAAAQADFTLQAAALSPQAVAPGGTSSINLTLGTINGFTGTVSLACQVTSTQTATAPPTCDVSPAVVTPPAGATATISTTVQTTPISYAISITGTGPSTTHTTIPQDLTVLAVTPAFTITVLNPVVPNSVPAGSGSQGTILLNPLNGYATKPGQAGITLSCATISPLVALAAPFCTFDPQPVQLTSGPITSRITINTFGPVITNAGLFPHTFYALWLIVPILGIILFSGIGGAKRPGKMWGALVLLALSGVLFLVPACGNATVKTTTVNGVTPNNTYTFTIEGVDQDGVVSSNSSSSTSANPTVTLTVTSPRL